VVREIRDQATRDWLQTVPYVLQFREPLPDAVKIGSPFLHFVLFFISSLLAT